MISLRLLPWLKAAAKPAGGVPLLRVRGKCKTAPRWQSVARRLRMFIAAAAWFAPVAAAAAPLSSLLEGGTLTAGSVRFTNWTLHSAQTTGNADIDPARIEVSTLFSPAEFAGLQYSAPFGGLAIPAGHPGASAGRLMFSYDVAVEAGSALVAGTEVTITGYSFFARPDARLRLIHNVKRTNNTLLDEVVVHTRAHYPSDDPNLTGRFDLPSLASLRVTTTIDVETPQANDEARLTRFTQSFQLVPEPSGAWLALAATCAWCLFGAGRSLRG